MTATDPRHTHRPTRSREDAPLPHHYPDLATGGWIACTIDWTSKAS